MHVATTQRRLDNDYTSLTETFGASAEIILATCVVKNND